MEKNSDSIQVKMKSFMGSPLLGAIISKALLIFVGIILIFLIFLGGESFGFHRAQFSYNMGENYNKIFGGKPSEMGMIPLPIDNLFSDTHGAYGKIVRINLPQIVIADASGVEKIITLDDDSIIKEFRQTVPATNLAVGDQITVLGAPDDNGQISVKLIRIMPDNTMATTTKVTQQK